MDRESVHIPLLGADGRRPPVDVRGRIEQVMGEDPIGKFQSIRDYEIKSVIRCGKYSEVLKVTDDKGDEFALKRMTIHSDRRLRRPCQSVVREITILRRLSHPHVIKLQGFVADDQNAQRNYFCMDYCQENLAQLLEDVPQLEQPELKCLMTMLLNGAAYLHKEHVIHRDISPKNLLICRSGMLKIGDFGKASEWRTRENHCKFGTPGYRAPEVILGYKFYLRSVDMWSIGCIFGELLCNEPVFSAEKFDISQFNSIIELCGSPVPTFVPNFHLHPYVKLRMIKVQPQNNFQNRFHRAPINAINLLEKFLTWKITGRVEAEAAQEEEYFSASPVSCLPEHLKIILDRKRKSLAGADGLSPISSEMSMSSQSRGAVGGLELSEISSGDFSTVKEEEIESKLK